LKKDIHIPEVKDVYIAVVREYNKTYKVFDWNAYIINDKPLCLDMVIIVTKGYSKDKITTTFRKKIDALPAKSFAKIEMIQEDVLSMNNVFNVSFFEDNKIYEKRFEFQKNTISESFLNDIPLMRLKGVLKS
tara:strand:+ start:360 stop:755 length:396 start_codon:yes stop_codon:yes gene_type:complete